MSFILEAMQESPRPETDKDQQLSDADRETLTFVRDGLFRLLPPSSRIQIRAAGETIDAEPELPSDSNT